MRYRFRVVWANPAPSSDEQMKNVVVGLQINGKPSKLDGLVDWAFSVANGPLVGILCSYLEPSLSQMTLPSSAST